MNQNSNPACPTCNDHGRIGNGRSPDDPGFDDGPCPEPDCAEGAFERGDAAPTLREVLTAPQFDMAAFANAMLRGIGRAA